ncbi:MAG: HAD family phosphatase [Gaiellales bacterium]
MPAPAAFVLDFNGTISDDEPLLEELYCELFAGVGLELSAERYHAEFAGLSDPAIIAGGLALAGRAREPGLAAQIDADLTARYLERVRDRSPVTPGAIGFVRAAAARVPVAIASGAARQIITASLARTGLEPLFTAIVSSEDVAHGKPDPEGYLRALGLLDDAREPEPPYDPASVWVVEDATVGVLAARAAGMRVVALRTAAYDAGLAPADLVIDRLDATLVERLFSRSTCL